MINPYRHQASSRTGQKQLKLKTLTSRTWKKGLTKALIAQQRALQL